MNTYEITEMLGRCHGFVWNGSAYFGGRFSCWCYIFYHWFNGYFKPQEGTDMMFVDS